MKLAIMVHGSQSRLLLMDSDMPLLHPFQLSSELCPSDVLMNEAPQVCISNSGLKSVLNIHNSAYSQTMPVAGRGKTDSKGGDTAMRTARDDDPDVPTQPAKTMRHYVFVPGPNKFLLAGVETRAAKTVDSVVHNFSRVRLWRHRATKHLTKVGHGDLDWWEQDMPQEPIVASHIVGGLPTLCR